MKECEDMVRLSRDGKWSWCLHSNDYISVGRVSNDVGSVCDFVPDRADTESALRLTLISRREMLLIADSHHFRFPSFLPPGRARKGTPTYCKVCKTGQDEICTRLWR